MQGISRTALLGLTMALVPAIAWGQTCNTADRSVLLILDASGSMNAKLPNGETRIAVARRAVKGVASLIPAGARLSLRLYGAQSPASEKNCEDTHVGVPFGAAGTLGPAIEKVVDATVARGYTPIAYSLTQAANDFPADAKQRVIVVVSDGKETCRGDPCVAARALAAKGVVVHTVGFIVDTAAREQLKCIARATGGSYFDAPVGPELPDTLRQALNVCKQTVVVRPNPKPGILRATEAYSHDVFNSETGKKVGNLNFASHEVTLPAGIYEVQFGPGRWKGIEVRAGETTLIAPGVIRIVGIPIATAIDVVDSETGESFGQIHSAQSTITVLPGLYDLRFGRLVWPFVKVDGGKTLALSPAVVKVDRSFSGQARVKTKDGEVVITFDAVTSEAMLPPGDYLVEVNGQSSPFAATEGQVFEVKER